MGEGLPYESQSEAETEDVFLTLTSSQRQIHAVEDRVNDFLSMVARSGVQCCSGCAADLLLDAVDVLGANAEHAHVLVDFERHLHLVVLDAADDQRLVQREVAFDACALHHLLSAEGLLYVAILAVTLDHDAVRD